MLTHKITIYKEIVLLGQVFRKGGINCIYGESGNGKTVSSIKAVNKDVITPILLDFDSNDSPEQNNCEYIHIDGISFMKKYSSQDTVIPRDQVIIIDTWALFYPYLETYPDLLNDLHKDNTIIVVAHNKDIATKKDIPDVESELINHWSSKLWLWFDEGSSAKSNPRAPSFNLTIKKLRGYKGQRTIVNWMRES